MSRRKLNLVHLGRRMGERGVDPIAFAETVGIYPLDLGAMIAGELYATEDEARVIANELACYPDQLTGARPMDSWAGKFGRSNGRMSIPEDNASGFFPEFGW